MSHRINKAVIKRLEQFCIEYNDFMKENFKPEPDEFLMEYRYTEPVKCDRKGILVKFDYGMSTWGEVCLRPNDSDILKVIKEIIRKENEKYE